MTKESNPVGGRKVSSEPVLQRVGELFSGIVAEHQLGNDPVEVRIQPLSPQQAIGRPQRQDFALLEGREVMIEAEFKGSFGQAFTDQPQSFRGTLNDVQRLSLDSSANRAVFVSTLNAVTSRLGRTKGTRHCRDDEPERCGSEIARRLLKDYGKARVGLVGYQPAILGHLTQAHGVENVRCSDLSPKNTDSCRSGVRVWDGRRETARLIDWCDLLLVTSSAIANDTFDYIYARAVTAQGKPLLLFGVTGAALAALLGLKRICPFGH
jgi:uncharacterized protein (DUF4213/DUF364 family)